MGTLVVATSLTELDERIAEVRDNIRELTEQSAAFSGAGDEARAADRRRRHTTISWLQSNW